MVLPRTGIQASRAAGPRARVLELCAISITDERCKRDRRSYWVVPLIMSCVWGVYGRRTNLINIGLYLPILSKGWTNGYSDDFTMDKVCRHTG